MSKIFIIITCDCRCLKQEDMLCNQKWHQGNKVAFALMNSPGFRGWNSAFIQEAWFPQQTKRESGSGKGRPIDSRGTPWKCIYTIIQIYSAKYNIKSTEIFLLVGLASFLSHKHIYTGSRPVKGRGFNQLGIRAKKFKVMFQSLTASSLTATCGHLLLIRGTPATPLELHISVLSSVYIVFF